MPALDRLASWLPGIRALTAYRAAWLRRDLLAGIALSAVLVPAGMGYAEAAGLPAITGLYATILPLTAYAIFGPSRILVLGPDSALIALIASTVLPLAGGDQARAVSLAAMLAVLTGVICVAAAALRLGFVTELVSKPVRYGYLNGIAVTVIFGQVPPLLGFSVPGRGLVTEMTGLVEGLAGGRTVAPDVVIGGLCLALILAGRAWAPRLPGVLVAVTLATVAVTVFGLSRTVQVVGPLPGGLPAPAVPAVGLADLGPLVTAALAIALVSFTDTSVLSRTFAIRGGYEVDANRELLALGAANLAGGLFQGFPISSSASRTPIAESSGARTQLTGVAAAATVAVLLLVAPGLVANLPMSALAAVVIGAMLGLFEIAGVRRLYRLDRPEFLLSMGGFLGVAVLGVLPGIAVAVGLSLLDFTRHAWRPHDAVLGRADGVKGYHDVTRYPAARQVPGLVLYRWDAPLFFANADLFRDRVRRLTDEAVPPARWVVVAAEPITDVDSTAADMLEALRAELAARGVALGFAGMKDPVKDVLERYGVAQGIGPGLFFPTVGMAVREHVASNHVDWTDWEDERR